MRRKFYVYFYSTAIKPQGTQQGLFFLLEVAPNVGGRGGNMVQSSSVLHPSCSWATGKAVAGGTEIPVDVV